MSSCNICFICFRTLAKVEVKRGRKRKEELITKRKLTSSINILMRYLLTTETPAKTFDIVLNDILKLSGASGSTPSHSDNPEVNDDGNDGGQGVPKLSNTCPQQYFRLCEKCEGIAGRILELHLELEKLQMKIIQEVQTVREAILRSSGWLGGTCEGGGMMDELEAFENFAGRFFEPDLSCSWKAKKAFEVLKGLQAAVAETDKAAVLVPLVYLRKYSSGTQNFQLFTGTGSPADIVKTEPISMDEAMASMEPKVGFGFPLDLDLDGSFHQDQEDGSPMPDPSVKIESGGDHVPSSSMTSMFVEASPISSDVGLERKSSKATKSTSKPKPTKRKRGRRKALLGRPRGPYKKKSVRKAQPLQRISDFYHCNTCNNFKCRSLNRLEQHLRNHETPEKTFHCEHCPHHPGFSIEQHFALHRRRHEGKHKLKCDFCQEFINSFEIGDHMKTHVEKPIPCSYCSQCLPSLERHMVHLRKNHTGVELKCEVCETLFRSKLELMEHLEEVHKAASKKICDNEGCHATFYDPVNLAAHKSLHTGRFTCVQCAKCFSSQHGLDYHLQRHAGKFRPYNYKCDQCPQEFPTRSTLYRHQVAEHGAPKLTCETCGKEYTGYEGLHNHRKVAHEGRGFPCPLCDKILPNRSQLKMHTERHHSAGKNYVCEECGMTFRTMEKCKKHRVLHGEKTFQCTHCPKAFHKKDYLITHLRTHTGEKPYSCEGCGKAFSQKGPLNLHQKKSCPGLASSTSSSKGQKVKDVLDANPQGPDQVQGPSPPTSTSTSSLPHPVLNQLISW